MLAVISVFKMQGLIPFFCCNELSLNVSFGVFQTLRPNALDLGQADALVW